MDEELCVTYLADRKAFRFCRGLHWMHFDARTGDILAQGRGWSCQPTTEEMAKWQELVMPYVERWGKHLDDLDVPLYIRFGRLPKSGYSMNHRTGQYEEGVSVYPACYNLETGAIQFDDDNTVHDFTPLLAVAQGLYDGKIFLVTGEVIGCGSDGEPILQDVHILALLRYDRGIHQWCILKTY